MNQGPKEHISSAKNRKLVHELTTRSGAHWDKIGEEKALALFSQASTRVPAYKKFLAEHNIDAKKIKYADDLKHVPFVDKENYLKKYPLSDLVWDGNVAAASMISRSSGSSGKPFYWPSTQKQREEVGEFYNLVFTTMFHMHERKTLVIIAYGMGSWVAGTTTLLSSIDFMDLHNCTFITPGYNKKEVIEICKDIGHEYEQIVLCAYPPLIKEIVDLGRKEKLDWVALKPKFVFGAEAFSEDFRDYLLQITGSNQYLFDSMNTIGTADAMVIGHETPLSIGLRRLICENAELRNDVLGPSRMPTVAQYYPWQKYLEIVDQELLLTGDGAIPLIRYNIHDNAKIYSYDELVNDVQKFGNQGIKDIFRTKALQEAYDWKLPFVFLYGKSTNALKFYGAIVYPENIKTALEKPEVASQFTGKFKMEVFYDKNQDQGLRLTIELAPGIKAGDIKIQALQNEIVKTVCALNSEYKVVYDGIGTKTIPVLSFVDHGHFDLEPSQNKHRYA